MGEKETMSAFNSGPRQSTADSAANTEEGRKFEDDAVDETLRTTDAVDGKKGLNAINVKLA